MKNFTVTEYFTGANGFETSETRTVTATEAAAVLKAGPSQDKDVTIKVKSANAARTKFGAFNKKAVAVGMKVLFSAPKTADEINAEEDFLAALLGEVA